jgi:flagellar hook assembly protein FlgD
MNGEVIRIISLASNATGYQLAPVEWDGKSSNGAKCANGIYPYRITVTTGKGETATVSGRMIIY